jgi:hypothetical protein
MTITELETMIKTHGYNVSIAFDRHGYHVTMSDIFGIGSTCVHRCLETAILKAHDTYQMAFRQINPAEEQQ